MHAGLKNEFTEDEKCHNLMRWLTSTKLCLVNSSFRCEMDESICHLRDVWLIIFTSIIFTEIPVLNANSADPDQLLSSLASDLGQHCLPKPLL